MARKVFFICPKCIIHLYVNNITSHPEINLILVQLSWQSKVEESYLFLFVPLH